MDSIKEFAQQAKEKGESVFQMVSEGYSAEHRKDGLQDFTGFAVPHDFLKEMVQNITPAYRLPVLEKTGKAVFTYSIPGSARFRITVHQEESGIRAVFKEIPSVIPTVERPDLPFVISRLADLPKGLVIVTGPPGSGKTSTLAAILEQANRTRKAHIITVEDPVEFIHAPRSCIIEHIEVGLHTASYHTGIQEAMRRNPDMIFMGEMKEKEIIECALKVSENGILVFGEQVRETGTVDSLKDIWMESDAPYDTHENLSALIYQRLLKGCDGKKYHAAFEILNISREIKNLWGERREDKLPEIAFAPKQRRSGAQKLEDDIIRLLRNGSITYEEAVSAVQDKSGFEAYMRESSIVLKNPVHHRFGWFLSEMRQNNASYLYLSAGQTPRFRLHGKIECSDSPAFQNDGLLRLLKAIAPARKLKELEENGVTCFSEPGNCRVHVHRETQGLAMTVKNIPDKIQSAEKLNLPPVIERLSMVPDGLVIVNGPRNSGKSTTIAAMIASACRNRRRHIITIEYPIEYLHSYKGSVIEQREVGIHTASYASGLRHALSTNADVIMISELPDTETISLALEAAVSGRLVIATVPGMGDRIVRLPDRILNLYPRNEWHRISHLLADALKGVISQVLIPGTDGKSRFPALEILVGTRAIKNLVRENMPFQLPSCIQTGKQYGMQLLDDALMVLFEEKKISAEDAYTHSKDKVRFRQFLTAPPADFINS